MIWSVFLARLLRLLKTRRTRRESIHTKSISHRGTEFTELYLEVVVYQKATHVLGSYMIF